MLNLSLVIVRIHCFRSIWCWSMLFPCVIIVFGLIQDNRSPKTIQIHHYWVQSTVISLSIWVVQNYFYESNHQKSTPQLDLRRCWFFGPLEICSGSWDFKDFKIGLVEVEIILAMHTTKFRTRILEIWSIFRGRMRSDARARHTLLYETQGKNQHWTQLVEKTKKTLRRELFKKFH